MTETPNIIMKLWNAINADGLKTLRLMNRVKGNLKADRKRGILQDYSPGHYDHVTTFFKNIILN